MKISFVKVKFFSFLLFIFSAFSFLSCKGPAEKNKVDGEKDNLEISANSSNVLFLVSKAYALKEIELPVALYSIENGEMTFCDDNFIYEVYKSDDEGKIEVYEKDSEDFVKRINLFIKDDFLYMTLSFNQFANYEFEKSAGDLFQITVVDSFTGEKIPSKSKSLLYGESDSENKSFIIPLKNVNVETKNKIQAAWEDLRLSLDGEI